MNYLFAPVNQGLIIMAIVGLLLMLLAIVTGLAPDLMQGESGTVPPLLRIPILGFFLSFLGVGSVPLLFLLGVYPFMIGVVGWSGNLWWYWHQGVYPNTTEAL
ncbi:MAG: hypothetical protein QNJ64_13475 [Crocosphaera sp.]|nr:hypothetical protein [Crocosphaera sp.]